LDGLESIQANKAQGEAGELFVRTRLKVSNEYEVWEQVNVRPESGTKVNNSRIDFLVRKIGDPFGEFFRVEVKTGDAVSSTNQNNLENTISNDELTEVRTASNDFSKVIETGGKFRISGSLQARVNPKTGEVTIEQVVQNPNSVNAKVSLEELSAALKNPQQQLNLHRILEDEEPVEAGGTISSRAKLPEVQPVEEEAPIENVLPKSIPVEPPTLPPGEVIP
jgi:hypothetical protein